MTINPTNTIGVNVSNVLVNNIINNGTISTNNGNSIYFNSTSTSANITNNWIMNAKGGLQIHSPVTITNNSLNSSLFSISYNKTF